LGTSAQTNYIQRKRSFARILPTFTRLIEQGVERKWRYARQSVEAIGNLLRVRKTETGYEIEIGKDFGLYRTVWTDKRYDANEYGTKIVSLLDHNLSFFLKVYGRSMTVYFPSLRKIRAQ
jgi:hypothetical protein